MLRRMPAHLFDEWMAFFGIEPFGIEAEWLGHAITSSTIANVNREAGSPSYSVSDFMPRSRDRGVKSDAVRPDKKSSDRAFQTMRAWASGFSK